MTNDGWTHFSEWTRTPASTPPAATPAATPASTPAASLPPMTPVRHRTPWAWLAAILVALGVFAVGLDQVNARIDGTETLAEATRVPLDSNDLASAELPAGWTTDMDALFFGYGRLEGDGVRMSAITGVWIGDYEALPERVIDRISGQGGPRFDPEPEPLPFDLADGVDGSRHTATDGSALYVLRNGNTSDVVALVVRAVPAGDETVVFSDAPSAPPVVAVVASVQFSDGTGAADA